MNLTANGATVHNSASFVGKADTTICDELEPNCAYVCTGHSESVLESANAVTLR